MQLVGVQVQQLQITYVELLSLSLNLSRRASDTYIRPSVRGHSGYPNNLPECPLITSLTQWQFLASLCNHFRTTYDE